MTEDNPTPARKLTVTFTGAFRRRPYMVTDTDPPSDLNPLARFRSERDAHQFAASDTILREHGAMKDCLERIVSLSADYAAKQHAREVLASLSPAPTTPPKAGE